MARSETTAGRASPEAQPVLRVAFAGTFAARLEERVRAHLNIPCDVIVEDDEVLRRADYLAITLSLSEATRALLGERELGLMKPTAVLINVSRAEIVVEEALYRALAQRTIAGAALDVWYRYPAAAGPTLPARHPFHELSNVLMTPHVSGWTQGMLEARATLIAENIHRAARGEPPANVIPSPE